MYTRSYFTEESKTAIPENYDGNAFPKPMENETKTEEASNPFVPPVFEERQECEAMSKGTFGLSSIMEKLQLKGPLSSLPFFKGENGNKFSFGTEEILICAAALYMFFSKSGDKECAIMLFILLFVR